MRHVVVEEHYDRGPSRSDSDVLRLTLAVLGCGDEAEGHMAGQSAAHRGGRSIGTVVNDHDFVPVPGDALVTQSS
jgi:hypothetical protein